MTNPIETALSAAEVLATTLPTTANLTTRQRDAAAVTAAEAQLVRDAVVGTFVGSRSYDIALALKPGLVPTTTAAPGDDAVDVEELALTDVVQTALTDAASRFGDGVLSALRSDDATALFSDPAAVVVELRTPKGVEGLFAVRPRPAAAAPATDADMRDRLGRISGVEMSLTVQIGRTRMAVRDVLGLEPGAIVELDRSAGSPADVLLNGRLIAHGEVVVVDQDYAVRITSILDGTEAAA